ncbi:MAG: lysyl-tRNA synthetase class 2 [Cellvibrionaceae bacterium]|jgi:lysyl-tRNA synthetase class 2
MKMNVLSDNWQTSATLDAIKIRADLYRTIRVFFEARKVLEVEVPLLGLAATVEPFIDSLTTEVIGKRLYLQTSPEFFLKRLLAMNSGDIYSLGKVFRQGEIGTRHRPEFTLLEWYRVGWDEHRLMGEVVDLVKTIIPDLSVQKLSYRQLFMEQLGVDPHDSHISELKRVASGMVDVSDMEALTVDDWLDLIMTHYLEKQLPHGLVLVFGYPKTKAALAALGLNHAGQTIARRFEAYLNGMELANGYYELIDAQEQRHRFEEDLKYRNARGFSLPPCDERLLAAMEAGLPPCAGVALGIDRLLMVLCNTQSIREVISFADG